MYMFLIKLLLQTTLQLGAKSFNKVQGRILHLSNTNFLNICQIIMDISVSPVTTRSYLHTPPAPA